MSLFHRHQHAWKVIKSTYAPPLELKSCKGGDPDTVLYMTMGRTDVLLQCETCSEVRTETMVGK